MADYKQMYLTLLDEVENTINRLTAIQKACEELYIDTCEHNDEIK